MPAVLGFGTPIKMKRLNPKSLFKMVSSCSDNHLWSVINASGNEKSRFSTVRRTELDKYTLKSTKP